MEEPTAQAWLAATPAQPRVMGILNVTPDSFSDGGCFTRPDVALRHAEAMIRAGATLIDIGGESTRPGARPVSAQQELDRVAPLVEVLGRYPGITVSVDTSTPLVMRETAALGAGLINDVRALRREGALEAAVDTGLPVCLMHMQGEPECMQQAPVYADVTGEVSRFLAERAEACVDAGISRKNILLDPGFGFGKTLAHNLKLFRDLPRLGALGYPLLVGVSRKSLVGQALGRPVESRLYGSLALAALAVVYGARIIRVHDVAETLDVVRMVSAVQQAG